MPTITVEGYQIEYRLIGTGNKHADPIVFLHHGFGSVSTWKDFPDVLCRRLDRSGIVYSRPSCGWSSPLDAPRQPDCLVKEAESVLAPLLDVLGIERPILFGHSNGATISLLYAALFPSRVLAVIALAPHVTLEPVTLAGVRVVAERYQTDPEWRRRIAHHHANPDAAFWAWANFWTDPSNISWNVVDNMREVVTPLLLLQGDRDDFGTLHQVDLIRDAVQGPTEALILENCGHDPHIERRQEVIDATVGFVSGLRRKEQPPQHGGTVKIHS
jgi:pimeloyl-ACP methyl ester carboxylesterase